eukprot:CAMPEP_0117443250 /NCGR_PEP_ID=MMETSP0759-20121206/4594_1 /TAXON_ID=63605 /ORGANISM="Percolomonas cosmopolitus, Strain WS" /LENGTH=889 /DNA_ID=CAMNT_0005235211 /DNA_START=2211 /DNA_END=4880 /DNA_ORIENTATION=+
MEEPILSDDMQPHNVDSSVDSFDQLPSEVLNEENKQLSRKVKEQQNLLREKEKERELLRDRIDLLDKHLKSVKAEVFHTQTLANAKHKEIETENHLRQLAEREIGRLSNDLNKCETQFSDVQDQLDRVQNEIFKANENLDKFKLQMNFNQEELEQWALAEKQKDEDMLQIERFRRKDDAKLKELNMLIEKLTRTLREKKQQYEQEITETQAAQIELNKTSEDFRQLHKERQDHLQQWEDAIVSMKKRDELIKNEGERFAQGKKIIREKQEQLFQESKQLEMHQQDNREMQQRITKLNRGLERKRSELESLRSQITELNDEIEVLKNTLAKASNDFNSQRIENKQLNEQLIAKQHKLENLKTQEEKENAKLSGAHVKLTTLEDQTNAVEKYLKDAYQNLKQKDKKLRELKDEQYKQSEELFKIRQQQANFVAEIGGTNAQNKNMQAKIVQMDNEAYKQQELLYNIGFQIQNMERKVHRAQGNRTEEEKEKLNAQIDALQSDLDSIEQQHGILSTELKKVTAEVRKYKSMVDRREEERISLESQVNELTLENDSHEKELKQLTRQKEDVMVNHDVLKLQVKRRRDLLSQRSDEVSGLENRKYQLELTLSEKEKQVTAQKSILVAELKAAEEERRNIALELAERRVQIDKLKNKFEILTNRLQPNPDEEVSQVKFLIQAIQEREELQRKGDMLDAEIQKLEREEAQMDKTLLLFKKRNSLYLSNFRRVDKADPHFQKKSQLELQIKEMERLINRRMTERKDYAGSCDIKARELEMAQQKKAQLKNDLEVLSRLQVSAEREVNEQQEHLERRRTQVQKELRKLDANSDVVEDMQVTIMRMKNRQLIENLQSFAQDDSGLQQTLLTLFQQFEIHDEADFGETQDSGRMHEMLEG